MSVLSVLPDPIRGILFTTPWLIYLLGADVVLSALLPLKPFLPRPVYDASSLIASSVWSCIQLIFTSLNGAHISISGDALPAGESAVVVANHVAWSDFYMVQALAREKGMLGRCRYFAKRQLRWVPFLGWGLWAIGMPMITRKWLRDRAELDRVFANTVNRGFPSWIISFSEATRFTPKKYQESQAWCKKNDRPQPLHLLYPRTKGFVATVQHLRQAPHVKAVYDLTIAYQRRKTYDNRNSSSSNNNDKTNGGHNTTPTGPADRWFQSAPTMWQTLSASDLGDKYTFHVHARRFPMEDLPQSDEELAKWLEQRWVEKGLWLEDQRQKWLAKDAID